MADIHISVNGRTTSAQKASLHFSTDPERNVLVPTGVPVVVGTTGVGLGDTSTPTSGVKKGRKRIER